MTISTNIDRSLLKIRIRWYGDLFEHKLNPSLEIKEKKGSLIKNSTRFSIFSAKISP